MIPQIALAVTRPNSPLAIVWVALVIKYPDKTQKEIDPTPEYLEDQIKRHFGDDWTSYRVIAVEALPQDSTWRNAWVDDGETIVVDLEKAKSILRDRIATTAAARRAKTDAALLEAMANGDREAQARLVAMRQALQKASDDPRITGAQSLDELKTIDPLASIG